MSDKTEPPSVTLYSRSLLSKWGFNDGGAPEALLDYWDEIGVDYTALDCWHPALRILVREHLLPELKKFHRIELYDIETIHNPIRARTVDGREVDHCARNDDIVLTPESVTVPYEAVAKACGIQP